MSSDVIPKPLRTCYSVFLSSRTRSTHESARHGLHCAFDVPRATLTIGKEMERTFVPQFLIHLSFVCIYFPSLRVVLTVELSFWSPRRAVPRCSSAYLHETRQTYSARSASQTLCASSTFNVILMFLSIPIVSIWLNAEQQLFFNVKYLCYFCLATLGAFLPISSEMVSHASHQISNERNGKSVQDKRKSLTLMLNFWFERR